MMTMKQATNQFLQWRKDNGYAKNTLDAQKAVLKHLSNETGWEAAPSTINTRHVLAVMDHDRAAARTANLRKTHISTFVTWCKDEGVCEPTWNPMRGIRKRKVMETERKKVNINDLERLVRGAETERERILLALSINLLLRISEVSDLRIKDINMQAGEVSVRIFKTSELDTMPMTAELQEELRKYLLWYTLQCGALDPDWYLIPSDTGGHKPRLQPDRPKGRLATSIQGSLRRIGWEDVKGEGGHTLRRSGARWMLMALEDQGVERALRIVQHMLHHKSLEQTEHYLGISVDVQHRNIALKGRRWYTGQQEDGYGQVVNL